jgi:hypothetical protein
LPLVWRRGWLWKRHAGGPAILGFVTLCEKADTLLPPYARRRSLQQVAAGPERRRRGGAAQGGRRAPY